MDMMITIVATIHASVESNPSGSTSCSPLRRRASDCKYLAPKSITKSSPMTIRSLAANEAVTKVGYRLAGTLANAAA